MMKCKNCANKNVNYCNDCIMNNELTDNQKIFARYNYHPFNDDIEKEFSQMCYEDMSFNPIP